ncbi:MAG: hypothetical protein KKF46_05480 [Nanoarchaeota archaeon]|nr:hypothetical protein [Nanoarchaeota archaeon]MBU1321784.1 hypothetical protein [Nanoarchaeota archaeon]MBU1598483.1 hypothetical protein [Nanoarchaeota archaeon]MBU2440817.1 hypothetical protein [Nanoarchaeota archaeon]
MEKYKKRDTLPLPVVHKDIVDDYLEYEQISIQEKESLKKLRKILNSTEIECVLMARRAFLASKRKDKKLFDELIGQLEKNCPENGKKLFNLMSTGYFDELILPFMDVMKSRHGEEKYVEEYNKFYRSLMKFFPTAVFVGNYTNQEKLKHEITKRLKLSNIPFIKLHAIGENNIVKVGKIVEELKIEKHYEVDDNRFSTPLGLKAQIYEIRIKKE